MAELPPFCCLIPNGFPPYNWLGFAICPTPLPPPSGGPWPTDHDAGHIIIIIVMLVQPALHAQVAWPIRFCIGLLMTAPGFGLAVPAARQCMCMATIGRVDTSIGPRLAMLQWPHWQPLSLTESPHQPCIYMASVPALASKLSSSGSALGSSPLSLLGSTLSSSWLQWGMSCSNE